MTAIMLDDQRIQVFEKSIDAMSEFKAAFGRGLSGDFLAELYAAKALKLQVLGLNHPGYDALGENEERYQIKYRSLSTQNVDVGSFDFDYLVLVNLDEEYRPAGLWRITAEQAQAVFTQRVKFRKYQTTQNKIKSVGEFITFQQPEFQTPSVPVSRRSWREIRGRAVFPMMGEDAQQWISRSRREEGNETEEAEESGKVE